MYMDGLVSYDICAVDFIVESGKSRNVPPPPSKS